MKLIQNAWKHRIIGIDGRWLTDPIIMQGVKELTAEAMHYWSQMEKEESRNFLWKELSCNSLSSELTSIYDRLRCMTIALNTPGSELEGNTTLCRDIVAALDWMLINRYNTKIVTYGNWWDWEIGAPLALTDIVLLMSPSLSQQQIEAYLEPIGRFCPEPLTYLYSQTRYPVRTSTGANRVWICRVLVLYALLLGDDEALKKAMNGLLSVFEYITEGEGGFYEDGSFVQHGAFAYTGGYGKSMISTLVPILNVMESTPHQVSEDYKSRIYDVVYNSYEPLLFRGSMMDMASGREVARYDRQNHEVGHIVIGALLELSTFAPPPHRDRLKQMVRYWMQEDTAMSFTLHAPLYLKALAIELLKDNSVIPTAPTNKYKMYGCMARAVLQRPEFAFGISVFSKRMATYETINDENKKGWYQSHGHTTLYNGDLGHYSDGYWPTVNPYRLAGITVTNQIRVPKFGHMYRNQESWAGGAELQGLYGSAGMLLEDYPTVSDTKPLRAKKSWFLFENEIVAIGSDIQYGEPFRVETVVENRKLNAEGTNPFMVNGKEMPKNSGWSAVLPDTCWMHLKGDAPDSDIGYYFPQAALLKGQREKRTGSWQEIGFGPDTEISRHYLTLWVDHGESPQNEGYAYVILPGFTSNETEQYAAQPKVEIIQQSSSAHAVYHSGLGILGINFWKDEITTVKGVTCSAKASVMILTTDDTIEIAISDPTHENCGIIEMDLLMSASDIEAKDDLIKVVKLFPTIKLQFNSNLTQGKTSSIILRR
ncbi:polysaccharide lyase 8 family protein [Paenibacillus silviterrae]|uniref:polysaccharide lyase 8 family protein n=1 Tax=Paenibacillus silviterrae TaxID=3242194 RepID=UPI002542BBD7|nr:polysaccharide lyase 8 family protein [Paenibacillus chinjuensis]